MDRSSRTGDIHESACHPGHLVRRHDHLDQHVHHVLQNCLVALLHLGGLGDGLGEDHPR